MQNACFLLFALSAVALIPLAGCNTSQPENMVYESASSVPRYRPEQPIEKTELPFLDGESDLEDYLSYAALNNAELKSRFHKWRAALNQIPQAKALPDPQFTYSYYIKEVETRVGPQEHKLGIMQKFPWFGKIESRTDAAAAAAKAVKKQYEAKKVEIFMLVKNVYAEFAYLYEAIEIARENLELLKHFEQVARTKYKAATATHPDVIRAQVEMAKVEDILRSLEELEQPVLARLNSVLNRPTGANLPEPEPLEAGRSKMNKTRFLAMVKKRNPQLQAIRNLIEKAQSRLELAKKQYWPDVGIGLGWIQTGSAVNPGVSDSGTDPVMLTFAMNLPLWRESYDAAKREARDRVREQKYQHKDTENTLLARAEKVLYQYNDSQRKLNLYGATLTPKAEELLQASETAYTSGKMDFLSLIDAQRMLLKFSLEYQRALRDNLQTFAELEMLAGGRDGIDQLSTESSTNQQ